MQTSQDQYAVIALGTFDGVHAGHRTLIKQAIALAKAENAKSVVYTFQNHPRSMFGDITAKLLQTAAEREAVLYSLGVDLVQMDEFDAAMMVLTPEEFMNNLLSRYRVRAIVIGFNYTFGAQGAGTPDTLREFGKRHGFDVAVVPPVLCDGTAVSSTRIRSCIEAGDMAAARIMLEAPYSLAGPVVKNRHIGSQMGFPTANIAPPPEKALPKDGVYATAAVIEGKEYLAITNVGDNPTVHGDKLTIETHILDFTENIYGEMLEVRFYERIRGEVRFADKDALAAQIAKDVNTARQLMPSSR